jgi:hypothetical protein
MVSSLHHTKRSGEKKGTREERNQLSLHYRPVAASLKEYADVTEADLLFEGHAHSFLEWSDLSLFLKRCPFFNDQIGRRE